MNRLAVSRSARAQQAHKINNRTTQVIPVGTGPLIVHTRTHTHRDPHRRRVILGLPRASSGRQWSILYTMYNVTSTQLTWYWWWTKLIMTSAWSVRSAMSNVRTPAIFLLLLSMHTKYGATPGLVLTTMFMVIVLRKFYKETINF